MCVCGPVGWWVYDFVCVCVCQFGYSWDQRFFQRQTALTSADTPTHIHTQRNKYRLVSVKTPGARGHLGTRSWVEGQRRTCKQNSHTRLTERIFCTPVKTVWIVWHHKIWNLKSTLKAPGSFIIQHAFFYGGGDVEFLQTLAHIYLISESLRGRALKVNQVLKILHSYSGSFLDTLSTKKEGPLLKRKV